MTMQYFFSVNHEASLDKVKIKLAERGLNHHIPEVAEVRKDKAEALLKEHGERFAEFLVMRGSVAFCVALYKALQEHVEPLLVPLAKPDGSDRPVDTEAEEEE